MWIHTHTNTKGRHTMAQLTKDQVADVVATLPKFVIIEVKTNDGRVLGSFAGMIREFNTGSIGYNVSEKVTLSEHPSARFQLGVNITLIGSSNKTAKERGSLSRDAAERKLASQVVKLGLDPVSGARLGGVGGAPVSPFRPSAVSAAVAERGERGEVGGFSAPALRVRGGRGGGGV